MRTYINAKITHRALNVIKLITMMVKQHEIYCIEIYYLNNNLFPPQINMLYVTCVPPPLSLRRSEY